MGLLIQLAIGMGIGAILGYLGYLANAPTWFICIASFATSFAAQCLIFGF